jgi:peptidoglycan/LPS O-acetylase OafA/YrhL
MTIESNRADIRSWTIMRGIAALAVVLFHFKTHVAYPLVSIPLIGPVIQHGDLGVDMFFILSGFVMTYVYGLPAPGTRFDFRKFYTRRFARIYPVHVVTLLGAFIMLAAGGVMGFVQINRSQLLWAVPTQLLLLHGIIPDTASTLNYPSWSISSEMFAYLLFPGFALLYRTVRLPILLVVASLVMLYVMMDATSLAAFGAIRVSTEFVLGMGLCLLLRDRHYPVAGPVVMLLGFVIFVAVVNCEGPRSLAIVGLAVAISGAFAGHQERSASPPVRLLVYLGQISYSLYMVHALVEAPGFRIGQILTGVPKDHNSLWVLAAVVLLAIVAAALLHHFVEQPCRRMIVARADRRTASDLRQ